MYVMMMMMMIFLRPISQKDVKCSQRSQERSPQRKIGKKDIATSPPVLILILPDASIPSQDFVYRRSERRVVKCKNPRKIDRFPVPNVLEISSSN